MQAILKLKEVPESCIDCPCEYDSIYCQVLGSIDGNFLDAEQEKGVDAWDTRLPNCPLEVMEESDSDKLNRIKEALHKESFDEDDFSAEVAHILGEVIC